MKLLTTTPIKERKKYDLSTQEVLKELGQSISREKDFYQKTLGMYELKNPSAGHEGIENRATRIEGLGLLGYRAEISKDRIGTDFMTNQPKYKERETILE